MRFRPHVASEFPNDNPELHLGARWVCLVPTARPRAVRRPLPQSAVEAPTSEVRQEESSVPPPVAALCERFTPHEVPHDPLLDEALDEALIEVLQGMEAAAPTATRALDSQTQSLIEDLADTVASALTWDLDEPAARALPAVATCAPELPSDPPSDVTERATAHAAKLEPCDAELDRAPPKRRRAPSRGRSPRFLTTLIRDVTDPGAIAV
ncbi:MAG: hypothetical protein KIT72_06500 [Polyangiaceae bacterium]|nr:hypothetical protein [Polyangiaceae bacterium]MCW5790052.1 hypothetical protein [Polyangiaceae bacterium]